LAFSIFRNVFSEIVNLSSLGKSENENIGSDTKIPTTLRMTTDRLFSKKVPPLKLFTAFLVSILKKQCLL